MRERDRNLQCERVTFIATIYYFLLIYLRGDSKFGNVNQRSLIAKIYWHVKDSDPEIKCKKIYYLIFIASTGVSLPLTFLSAYKNWKWSCSFQLMLLPCLLQNT